VQTDLDRLATALADRYAIVCELGAGGMLSIVAFGCGEVGGY
jgi:hypothetical protein